MYQGPREGKASQELASGRGLWGPCIRPKKSNLT